MTKKYICKWIFELDHIKKGTYNIGEKEKLTKDSPVPFLLAHTYNISVFDPFEGRIDDRDIAYMYLHMFILAGSCENGTYYLICEQRKLRRAYAFAQSRQSFRC